MLKTFYILMYIFHLERLQNKIILKTIIKKKCCECVCSVGACVFVCVCVVWASVCEWERICVFVCACVRVAL